MKFTAKVPLKRSRLPQPSVVESALGSRVVSDFGDVTVRPGLLLRHTLELNGYTATCGVVATRLPQDYLQNRASLSSWWKTALDDLHEHTSYLDIEVEAKGDASISDPAVLLTHVVAVYLHHTDGLGVYWGDGILNDAATFLELSDYVRKDAIQGTLWVNIGAIAFDDGSINLTTFGLADFDLHDVEIDRVSTNDAGGIVGYVCRLIEQWLLGNVQLPNGTSIPGPENMTVRSEIGESWVRDGDLVVKLLFDESQHGG